MKIVCLKEYLIEPLKQFFPSLEIVNSTTEDAEIFIAESKDCVKTNLSRMPRLKFVQTARAGYDAADIEYIRERNLTFCNAKGLYSIPIAEDIVNKILIYTTNTLKYLQQKNEKIYKPIQNRYCLSSLCIGFLGTGSIASEAAKRLKSFDCKVIGYKRSKVNKLPYFDELYYGDQLSELLSKSDIVVVTLDLNPSTYHIIDEKSLNSMKKGAAIINIARGEVLDENAIVNALKSEKLSYAGLDVFENEPLSFDSELWRLKQVMITPHASGICHENHEKLFELVKKNITSYINNKELINVVNR